MLNLGTTAIPLTGGARRVRARGGSVAPEPAEHGALAQSRPFRQPVHGRPGRALSGEHLAGRGQQVKPVACGICAFGVRRSPDDGLVHEFTLPAGIRSGV